MRCGNKGDLPKKAAGVENKTTGPQPLQKTNVLLRGSVEPYTTGPRLQAFSELFNDGGKPLQRDSLELADYPNIRNPSSSDDTILAGR